MNLALPTRTKLHTVVLTALFAVTAGFSAGTETARANEVRTYDNFSALRSDILDLIAGATERIWMSTGYLTDGEIVSALYVARYRKLDVTVLLGKAKANHYMSRLNYLKNQNIPVWLRPDQFRTPEPTALLLDRRLVLIDGEMDFLARVRRYQMRLGNAEETAAFTAAFARAAETKMPAVPLKMPLVGRPNTGGRTYDSGGQGVQQSWDTGGAFIYSRKPEPRPEGVPAKLPKGLKWQEKPALQGAGASAGDVDVVTDGPDIPAEPDKVEEQ